MFAWQTNRFFLVEPSACGQVDGWKNDETLKRQFGIELTKTEKPFEAACVVFKNNTQAALWISQYWINDPIVLASKETSAPQNKKLLDKEELAAKLLTMADEKTADGRFFLHELKDRRETLKLYSEVMGFTGKIDVDASTNNFTNNVMKIVFVKPKQQEIKEEKIIEHQEQETAVIPLPMKLKFA